MLASGKMVGFVPTKDYDKARAFYEGNLGCEFISLDQYALVMSVGGHKIRIAKVPNFTPLQGTILGWEVDNIEAIVTWLRDRGVVLEKYPFVQDRELGIWTTPTGDKVAWFKDPWQYTFCQSASLTRDVPVFGRAGVCSPSKLLRRNGCRFETRSLMPILLCIALI